MPEDELLKLTVEEKSKIVKKFYVYKITCIAESATNKLYIGKTSGENPNDRFSRHKTLAFSQNEANKNQCPKLYNAMRKYGKDNFIFEILETYDDENIAYQREGELVIEYDSLKNGLNTIPGGIGAASGELNPMYGKGYLISGENNGMFGKTGELNPFYGKKTFTRIN